MMSVTLSANSSRDSGVRAASEKYLDHVQPPAERTEARLDVIDAQIAGIVMARRSVLATRNVRDFEGLDIPLVDPWTA
jgi:predicted nucleic acid-binding protein